MFARYACVSRRRFDEARLLFQTNARAAAFKFVRGQEDYTALFERAFHEIEPAWKNIGATFVTSYGRGPDAGGVGQFRCAPSKGRSRHTHLRSRDAHASSPTLVLTLIYF